MPFPAAIELSAIAAGDGSQGFVVTGISPSAYSVASAGDLNGDGIDDFVIGASQADPSARTNAGQTYVVFGNAAGFSASFSVAALDGTNGFVINGVDRNDFSGFSVASAGDVNGDGIGDLIVGAYGGDPSGRSTAGETYIVYGSEAGFGASLDLSTINGANGFVINGIDGGDQSGSSVASAGDVNGDGIGDLIIGAPGAFPGGDTGAGETYVVFGSDTGIPASLDLSTLNGANGFVLVGIDAVDFSGASVASAGDVNGDGIDDLIIGAFGADPGGNADAGETYIVFGSTVGFSASLDLSTLNGANGFVINGIAAGDVSGLAVASAGDVNGDGIDDLMIGGYGADPGGNADAGATYIVFGTAAGFSASFDLSSLDGSNGFTITGVAAGDLSGIAVASAGDVNGDGIGDIVIGGYTADPGGRTDAGQSYVVFGTAAGFAPTLDLSTLNGTNGFVINGPTQFGNSGFAVSGAGDVDGDGYADLLIGSFAGNTYVVFGRPSGQTEGTAGNDILVGARGQDTLNGYEGNDTLIGSGSADVMAGGAGDDYYESVTTADTVIELADEGTDTIRTRVDGFTLGDNVENLLLFGTAIGGNGNELGNRIVGTLGDNSLYGFGGNDVLVGLAGNDTLHGGAGDDFYEAIAAGDTIVELADEGTDTIATRLNNYVLGDHVENLILAGNLAETASGNALANEISGANRSNALFGFDGDDLLRGLGGADTLDGGAGSDTLGGGMGNDILLGGEGDDVLIGGGMLDLLTGGVGADTFVFLEGDFESASSADRITDFSRAEGDIIDLSGLDAIAGTPELDGFAFIGTSGFSGAAGELRYIQRDGFAVVQGDIDGDGLADFGFRVEGVTDLLAGDFDLGGAMSMPETGRMEPLAPSEFLF